MRYTSPATDLMFCIFTSTDKMTRETDFENLLRIYYGQLASNIEKLGSDPNALYPYEQLKSDLPLCGDYLMVSVPILMQVSLVVARNANEVDDTFDVCFRSAVRENSLVGLSANAQLVYTERINDCIEDLEKLGCLESLKKIKY